MRSTTLLGGLIAVVTSSAPFVFAQKGTSGAVWATPHDSYSSSVGVLGCKVDTNRIAYWPGSVDCNNICISLTYEDRTVRLLRVDQSQGAFDVSYDAWNYLYTGYSATAKPTAGGALPMNFETLPAGDCADLIHTEGSKLPLSASNSMNFLASCLAQPDSWVAKNYVLYNILDSVCSWGYDETCTLDWPTANQAKCQNALGQPVTLTSAPVYNIKYPSGETVNAASQAVVPAQPESYATKPSASFAASLAPSLLGIYISLSYVLQGIL
ncbi:uncharacterized protein B0I36DRAFT_321554 [Microdochium trichocladiopsis]|uniref:Cerato-platanin n=1 Tax=Microdochium trichocladiopsis TaxID=1682393 RepID=A0A9P8YA47_9PEZI|nr:uncharacterized protein B0I36DRAFT_321554 [Microdochium trichocladiopsis]KAH7033486.1 hypothetical protein B0I36DRAFT_321554 [Microdochium trichocladiopsis]